MSYHFNRIALIASRSEPHILETVKSVYEHLTALGTTVTLEQHTAEITGFKQIGITLHDQLKTEVDLAVVIGGDGSMLRAARMVAEQHVPVIGINRGYLGFLTDISPEAFDKIEQILLGNYIVEKRFLLYAHMRHEGQTIGKTSALNDVVLLPDEVAHMIEFEIYINDQFMCSQRSDGLIIATPTGSTAYALSGGGPILHPGLDAIVLVPMFPHSLTYRPIVVDGNSEIKLVLTSRNGSSPGISCDGQPKIPLKKGDTVHIVKNHHYLKLIHPVGYDYYEGLRSKLHWSHK